MKKKQTKSLAPSWCRPGGYAERYFILVKQGKSIFPLGNFEAAIRPPRRAAATLHNTNSKPSCQMKHSTSSTNSSTKYSQTTQPSMTYLRLTNGTTTLISNGGMTTWHHKQPTTSTMHVGTREYGSSKKIIHTSELQTSATSARHQISHDQNKKHSNYYGPDGRRHLKLTKYIAGHLVSVYFDEIPKHFYKKLAYK